jgi:hypothetical protein
VVPGEAVQAGQQGSQVFVVKPDLTVEARRVKVGRRLPRELAIDDGLRAGERVVTDGQLWPVPGARVDIQAPENVMSSELFIRRPVLTTLLRRPSSSSGSWPTGCSP